MRYTIQVKAFRQKYREYKDLGAIHKTAMHGKRILIRADFDVTLKLKKISDDFRIQKVLPTIRYCLAQGGRVRILSHLGRPGGRRNNALSMEGVARHLERIMKKRVIFISDPFDAGARDRLDASDDLLFFENIRFWQGEEKNSPVLARKLAAWGDMYVNEAFANSHRTHASMSALAHQLPAYVGVSCAQEIFYLSRVRDNPLRPFVAVLGGAKLETKMPLLRRFLNNADVVIVGGELANTVFSLQGREIGKSTADTNTRFEAAILLHNAKLNLPQYVVVVKKLDGHRGTGEEKMITDVCPDDYIVDVGRRSIAAFEPIFKHAATIVWNGPFGYTTRPEFMRGTRTLARAISVSRALTVVGGGDTIAALDRSPFLKRFTHVSTGGGAMLAFLAGEKMPGLEALKR